jgi:hypothetical protein
LEENGKAGKESGDNLPLPGKVNWRRMSLGWFRELCNPMFLCPDALTQNLPGKFYSGLLF